MRPEYISIFKSKTSSSNFDRILWIFGSITIILCCAYIFLPLWNAPPLDWDDDYNIWKNPAYVVGPWWKVWIHSYYGMYIPVTSSVWALLYHLRSGASWPFRLFNLILHLVNSALLGQLLFRCEQEAEEKRNPLRVLVPVLFFAIHPLQVAAVAWISGGRDLLATSFALSATYLLFFGKKQLQPWASTLLFIAGILSKPAIAALPPTLGLMSWFYSRRDFIRHTQILILWTFASIVIGLVTFHIQAGTLTSDLPLWFRPLIALDSYGFMIQKLLLPLDLAVDYGRTPLHLIENPQLLSTTIPLALLSLGALVYSTLRRNSFRGGWGWFLLLAPVSGLVPFAFQVISTVTDHYQYLPMALVAAGIFKNWDTSLRLPASIPKSYQALKADRSMPLKWKILNSRYSRDLINSRRNKGVQFVIINILLMIGTFYVHLSANRAKTWSNNQVFFGDMAKNNPRSYSAGIALANQECAHDGDLAVAEKWLQICLEQRPLDPVALAARAYCLFRKHRYQQVLEMQNLLLNPQFLNLAMSQDFAFASLLAAVGSSAVYLGQLEKGLALSCVAQAKVYFDPTYQRNIEIIKDLFKAQGKKAECPAKVDLEKLIAISQ